MFGPAGKDWAANPDSLPNSGLNFGDFVLQPNVCVRTYVTLTEDASTLEWPSLPGASLTSLGS